MRERLIELLSAVQYQGNAILYGYHDRHISNSELADHLLANGVTLVPDNNVGKWIPVTERLPEDRELVLCFKKGGFGRRVAILTFAQSLEALHEYDFEGQKHSGFVNYDSEVGYYEVSDVTHWMPLPPPPKEDAE